MLTWLLLLLSRIGQPRRRKTIYEAKRKDRAGSSGRRRYRKGSQRPNIPIHEIRSSRKENGRNKGFVQGRRHGQKRKPSSDGQTKPANGENDGSEGFASNGRHERIAEHDAPASARCHRGSQQPHGRIRGKVLRVAAK